MTDDTQAAREAFEAWFKAQGPGEIEQSFIKQVMFNVWLAASGSIPAAAALLRAAGWTVEEPKAKCPDCGQSDWHAPTCNGTGARL